MPDSCNPDNCPVNARVEGLEKEFDRYRSEANGMHQKLDERIGALEQSGAAVREKLDSMDEKLDGLTKSVKALTDKPGNRWEKAVETVLVAIVTGVVCFLLGRMGL